MPRKKATSTTKTSTTQKKTKPKKPIPIEDFKKDESVKDGINDLMSLPVELIQKELIKRNYHQGMVDAMPKWFLVGVLRNETQFERNKKPIFDDDAQTLLNQEEEHKEEETQNEPNTDFSVDPNEFINPEQEQKPQTNIPHFHMFGMSKKYADVPPVSNNGMKRDHIYELLEYGISLSVITNLPQQVAQAITADFNANKPVPQIIITHIPSNFE
ncbi:hypothetical protein GPJ56_004457 [Histomonas meleagridis]|uniref:uncharacterized protein n=1 Tax=Histomonas meleagridis TaxID=135588 RepID=UPI003559FB00|nr:hypothetical protein GPJ56_004457 [Histomonas meleagridis]KAH0802015.1 hypothetical protein GO595_005096 [Histomonas meleagridis]